MSNSYQPIQPVLVKDPRTILKNKRYYAVTESGKQVTYKQFTTNSIDASSITFSCPPPSGSVIVDRRQTVSIPVRLTFTGPGSNTSNILQPNRDAPRAFPLSSALDTLQVTINNSAVSINLADVIKPLLCYNTDTSLKDLDYSTTPTYPDQSQNYVDLFGSNRNPLSYYGDQSDENTSGRAGAIFKIISNSTTSAVVDMIITEPLFLPPFYWGHGNKGGFVNVNTMDFQFTFLSNGGAKMWSHDNSLGTNEITNVTMQFSAFNTPDFSYPALAIPTLLFTYITPLDTQLISPMQEITYPYSQVLRFITDLNQPLAYSAGSVGSGTAFTTNNIQLSSVPRRMFLFARPSNSVLNAANGSQWTDAFYGISNINLQFNNALYLNSASQSQLYQIGVKNGLNVSWNSWSGFGMYPVGSFNNANQFGGLGSCLCLEFGTDIPLDEYTSSGSAGQYNLQVTMNVFNADPTGAHDAVNVSLWIVCVFDGTFTIPALGRSIYQIGVLSKTDVLNAKSQQGIAYSDVANLRGGDFMSVLNDIGNGILKGLQALPGIIEKVAPIIEKVGPLLAAGDYDDDNPNPYNPANNFFGGVESRAERSRAARLGWEHRREHGMGEGRMRHARGGGSLSRSELQRRLRY